MKIWMSEEIQSDVANAYMHSRKQIETLINDKLSNCILSTVFDGWTFIGIVINEDYLNYREIKKKHVKRKVLEFRLKIDHMEFKSGSEIQRTKLIINALRRCVELMAEFEVSIEDRQKLYKIIEDVENEIIAETSK